MIMAVMVTLMVAISPLLAEEGRQKADQDPIRITADKLVTDNQKRSARFSGNVKAVQGDTVITTDRLTLFYSAQKDASEAKPANSIERIEAAGHVRIEFDNKVAVSNQAVYIIEERKLVLWGPESKVISGQDEIVGSKITFHRDRGTLALEGDGKNRVKAIIHSDQRSLN
jgi:lipopolysaccharide export system protein LptA